MILGLFLLYGGVAQSAPIATVPVSPTPLVTVTAATPDKLPGLDADMVGKFHQNTFRLTNESSQNMLGLMIRWSYTNAAGTPIVHNISTDSFDEIKINLTDDDALPRR